MKYYSHITDLKKKKDNMDEKKIIYEELISIFLETPDNHYVGTEIRQRVNALIAVLSKEDQYYQNYIIQSENQVGSVYSVIFKQKIRSLINVMKVKLGFEDLSEFIKRNSQPANMSFNNNLTSNSTQSNNQNIEISINEKVAIVIQEIEKNLTDEQLIKIKPLINDYQKKPTRIATEKLIDGILNFGKDISIGIISNVISKQMGI